MLGRRRVILAATFVFASAPFLYLLVSSPWQLVAVRLYHGFATAIFGPVALALVADLFASGRGEGMGWYSSATLVGRFIAPVAGGVVLSAVPAGAALAFGLTQYGAVFVVCGVGGVLAFVAAATLPIDDRAVGGDIGAAWRKLGPGLREVTSSSAILATSATEALQYFSFGALETFLPLYAVVVMGLSEWQVGVFFGVQLLTTALTKPIMGRASDRIGRRPMIALGLVTSAAGMAVVTLTNSYLLMLLVGVVYGLGLSIVTSSTSAYVSELAKSRSYGSAMGVLSTIMDVGHSTGPMVTGVLVVSIGYQASFLTIAALLLVGTALFWYVAVPDRAEAAVTKLV
jgi:MFS family permease